MKNEYVTILDCNVPQADVPIFNHLLQMYAGETNRLASMVRQFSTDDLSFRIAPDASSVEEILHHQLLSECDFFSTFLDTAEPEKNEILPSERTPAAYAERMIELALPRLVFFGICKEQWWLQRVKFFDVMRERIWLFWRRVIHMSQHRSELGVYLRVLQATREHASAVPNSD